MLPWPEVVQYFTQNIDGRKRKPGEVDIRHWDAIAREALYRPSDVRARVKELVNGTIAHRVEVAHSLEGVSECAPGYVEQAADLI